MLNNALVLLEYVATHRDEYQSYRVLSEATGIPLSTLHYMLNWGRKNSPLNDLLVATAYRFGYRIAFIRKPGKIIDVVKVGLVGSDGTFPSYDEDFECSVNYM